jgi:hypothetical protein
MQGGSFRARAQAMRHPITAPVHTLLPCYRLGCVTERFVACLKDAE